MATSADIPVEAEDGHRWSLIRRVPAHARASLLWLPALGVAAKHYLPFAEAMADKGIAVFVHEWRGNGSSSLRADRRTDWGYRTLLQDDIPASERAVHQHAPALPRFIGGHSLGGQLACCRLALSPASAAGLWLVAGGAPYWRAFPAPTRWWLPLACRFLPWLARVRGSLPGRRIGFGGNEARGVITDWSRTALSGRYAAAGLETDLEAALGCIRVPIRSVGFAHDWLAPASSLRFLLSKLQPASIASALLDEPALGVRADHFAWMRQPRAVAATLAE